MKNKLEKLFKPKSVAIVGATEKEGKIGNVIAKNTLELGYQGKIFFVNPKHKEMFGKKCYKNLTDISEKIDIAIIVVPSKIVNSIVKESSSIVKNFVIISAGFSEGDKKGRDRENELLEIAKKNQLNILGPNCLGFVIPQIKLNASFAGGMPENGGISLVSQSGALAVAMLDMAEREQFKFAQIISVGNKMQLDESRLIEYLGEDEQTKVIVLYLEGIKNGKEFMEIAKKVSQKKPIIILKAGKSEKAKKAINSHTGALAGSDDAVNVAFEKSGILRADNLDEFFNLIKFITTFKSIKNINSAIITNAGGIGVLTTDNFKNKTVRLAELSDETKDNLRKFLPGESSVENPIDLLGDADEIRYQKALNILKKEKRIGNILCLLTAQEQTPVEKIAETIVEFSKKSSQNIIPIFIGDKKIKKALHIFKENNIPTFNFPKEVVDVLDKVAKNNKKIVRKFDRKFDNVKENIKAKKEAIKILNIAKREKRSVLFFEEANRIMQGYNIPIIEFLNISKKSGLITFRKEKYQGEYPVVLKVDSDNILHKTDQQALILGIKNEKELRKKIKEMRKNFPREKFIVQPMLKSEVEIILGMKEDTSFGKIIVFGLGGIYTEVFKMIDFMILPLTRDEIRQNILQGKTSFLFQKTRGKIAVDIDEMIELIYNFSQMVKDLKQIKEVDINPILINDKMPKAVDIKILI